MSIVDNNRPPYVAWETRPVEDRTASIANGHYTSKDIDFAVITRPGSRDTLDREALVWLTELKNKAAKGEVPAAWFEGFKASYDSWKKGEELPANGTAIKDWPPLSPSARKDILAAGIRTVEDLADLSDSDLTSIGTGALAYKQKAQAWLKASGETGKVAEQITTLTQQIAELTALTTQLLEENKTLKASLPKPTTKA